MAAICRVFFLVGFELGKEDVEGLEVFEGHCCGLLWSAGGVGYLVDVEDGGDGDAEEEVVRCAP